MRWVPLLGEVDVAIRSAIGATAVIALVDGFNPCPLGACRAADLLIYVLDEPVLFAAVVVTLRISRFEERHGRLLKLLAGTVMLALGVVLFLVPGLMENLAGAGHLATLITRVEPPGSGEALPGLHTRLLDASRG